MPLYVDPTFVWPPDATVAKSTDQFVSAMVDVEHAAVHLKADFSATYPIPKWVRFVRQWDGQPVRGGDPRRAIGGIAIGYDFEAPLGIPAGWYATPINDDGSEGAPTAVVSANVPEPSGGSSDPSTWIKCIEDPRLSIQAMIESWPSFASDVNANAARIRGEQNAFVSYDVPSGETSTASFRTMSIAAANAMEDIYQAGSVVLFQTTASYFRPSFYAVLTSRLREDQARYWQYQIKWTFDLIEVDRPPTETSQLSIPGFNLSDRLARFPTLSDIPPGRTLIENTPWGGV